jgi:hypothetical protein
VAAAFGSRLIGIDAGQGSCPLMSARRMLCSPSVQAYQWLIRAVAPFTRLLRGRSGEACYRAKPSDRGPAALAHVGSRGMAERECAKWN